MANSSADHLSIFGRASERLAFTPNELHDAEFEEKKRMYGVEEEHSLAAWMADPTTGSMLGYRPIVLQIPSGAPVYMLLKWSRCCRRGTLGYDVLVQEIMAHTRCQGDGTAAVLLVEKHANKAGRGVHLQETVTDAGKALGNRLRKHGFSSSDGYNWYSDGAFSDALSTLDED